MSQLKSSIYPSIYISFYLSVFLSVWSLPPLLCSFSTVKESLSNQITVVGLVPGSVVPDCLSNYLNEGGKFDYKSAVGNKRIHFDSKYNIKHFFPLVLLTQTFRSNTAVDMNNPPSPHP